MDIYQMDNILHNLTNLESFFRDSFQAEDYLKMETYDRFLNQHFIKNRHLESLYWPQPDETVLLSFERPEKLSLYSDLAEQLLFFHGDITLMKQINLPFDHMLTNDFFQCIYIMEGTAQLKTDDEILLLSEGDFFILFPGIRHILNTSEETIAVNILVRKRRLLSEKFQMIEGYYHFLNAKKGPGLEDTAYILFHTKKNTEIHHIVLHMFVEYLEKNIYWEQTLDGYLTILFACLLRYKTGEIEFSFQPDRSQQIFGQIFRYCGEHANHVTLSEVADYLHFSRQYICRIVKEQTGETFSSLIMRLKLKEVRKYLEQTNLTLEIIAEITGFADASHLSRMFKKNLHISPSVYRNEFRTRQDE